MPTEIRDRALPVCPSCGNAGKPVKAITIESLVAPEARRRVGRVDGFRFCAEPSCAVAYFHPETGARISKGEVRVRIGQKETEAPRPVCYCFDHTVEEIEAEVAQTGASKVGDEITAKCRQGLDRCEETNPQGSCCLGNVRRALKAAQARREGLATVSQVSRQTDDEDCCAMTTNHHQTEQECCAMTTTHPSATETLPAPESSRRAGRSILEPPRTGLTARAGAGGIAQIGALASAVLASACCWLPLLLIAVGVSGGALSAAFEAWRPVLLPVTFVLLGTAFYFTYRKPRVPASAGAGTGGAGNDCCAVPVEGAAAPCCPPERSRGITLKKVNKVTLWVVAAWVLAFAFFPNYVGALLGGQDTLAARGDLDKVVVAIEGMTCEACAVSVADALQQVPGVEAAEVSFDAEQAVVGVARGAEPPRAAILAAISRAGDYTGRFADQVRWTLAIEGMTCEGCAAGLQASLARLPGVTSASVSYEEGRARIATGASVTEEILRRAVSEAGYGATAVEKE